MTSTPTFEEIEVARRVAEATTLKAIIIFSLVLIVILIQKTASRTAPVNKKSRKKIILRPDIVDWGVRYFSIPHNKIPCSETSIGRNMSAFYVHKQLLSRLKMEECEVILDDTQHEHAFKIVEKLEESGVIVFDRQKTYA